MTSYLTSSVLVDAFILILSCFRIMALPTQPTNVVLTAGDNATLQCASGEPSVAQWYFLAVGSKGVVRLTSLTRCGVRNNSPYQVNGTDLTNGQCDLIINNVTASSAGWYQCYMFSIGSETHIFAYSAQVTVLYSSPNCSVNVTNGVAAAGDDVSMECAVSYTSEGVNATMTWTGCQYYGLTTHTSTNGTITTIVSIIYVVAQQPYLQSCISNTTTDNQLPLLPTALPYRTNISSDIDEPYSYVWVSDDDIQVQHCPDIITMFPPTNSILPPNGIISCQANGNPTPTFNELRAQEFGGYGMVWTLTITNSSSLTLFREGLYSVTCKATNYIISSQKGFYACTNQSLTYQYNISSSVILPTTSASSTPSSPVTTVPTAETLGSCVTTGIVAVFVVLGIEVIVAVIALVICRCKSGCLIYEKVHGSKDETTQHGSTENQNKMTGPNANYEKLQPNSTTQLHQEMANLEGGYQSQALQTGSPVDPDNVVYTELQTHTQAENRENPTSERTSKHKHGSSDVSALYEDLFTT